MFWNRNNTRDSIKSDVNQDQKKEINKNKIAKNRTIDVVGHWFGASWLVDLFEEGVMVGMLLAEKKYKLRTRWVYPQNDGTIILVTTHNREDGTEVKNEVHLPRLSSSHQVEQSLKHYGRHGSVSYSWLTKKPEDNVEEIDGVYACQ